MYIIKNSIKNIIKNWGRYILFGLLIVILLITGLISLKTYYSADTTINRLKQTLSSTYSIAQAGNNSSIVNSKTKLNEKIKIASFDEVDYYNIKQASYYFRVSTPYFETDTKFKVNNKDIDLIENDYNPRFSAFGQGSIYIIGYNEKSMNIFSGFMDDDILFSGRMYENDNECVILKSLYDINNYNGNPINIGDEIEFYTFDTDTNEPVLINYKIVGILHDDKVLDDMFLRIEKRTAYHGITFIYTSMESAARFDSTLVYPAVFNSEEGTFYEFYGHEFHITLKSPDLTEQFLEKVYDFERDDENNPKYTAIKLYYYSDEIIEPLERTKNYNNILILTTGTVFFAVMVIMTFAIMNERKYDIGVLRSIGMSKPKLILNFISEIFIFMLAVCAIGLTAGYFISENITFFDISAAEYGVYADFTNTFASSMVFVFGFTVIISIFSSILALIYIVKYNPMKILRNRT